MIADFLADKQNHSYHINGRKIPSVTDVLGAMGLYKGDDFFDPAGLELGSKIHLACEYYDRGTLNEETLDPVLAAYLTGWKNFLKDTGFKSRLIEQPMYSNIYNFAGTPDRIGIMDGHYCIPDIKHGGKQPCYALQTAGYFLLLMESDFANEVLNTGNGTVKRASVYLDPNGRPGYKVEQYKERSDIPDFLAVLTAFKLRRLYQDGSY